MMFSIYKTVPCAMLVLGFASLLGSVFYSHYVLAMIGLGLTFWGVLFLYLRPSKYVKLELLTAAASSTLHDIERILTNAESNLKGIYLPPRLLKDYHSSLIFIRSKDSGPLPKQEETSEDGLYSNNWWIDWIEKRLCSDNSNLFLTPPGLALSRVFERKLGKSFIETDLNQMQEELPRLFEGLEITKNLSLQAKDNIITVQVADHIFKDLCTETAKLPKTHETVGCPFSSAIACALAKATGKPVTIEKELQNLDGSTRIQYRLLEE